MREGQTYAQAIDRPAHVGCVSVRNDGTYYYPISSPNAALINQIGGPGFYEGGGLIGYLFRGGRPLQPAY
jgi:hypothetical protein